MNFGRTALAAGIAATLSLSSMSLAIAQDAAKAFATKPAAATAQTAADILNRWQPVAVALGLDGARWREVFETQLAQMDAGSLRTLAEVREKGSPSASYEAFTQAFRGVQSQRFGTAEAKTALKLASTTTDQVFFPINPCRIVDSRVGFGGAGPIAAGTQRAYYFYANAGSPGWSWSTQGGTPGTAVTVCPGTTLAAGGTLGSVPPSAAVATVTVVAPSAAGNWVIWGGDGTFPQSSALNWSAGQNLANTTVIPRGSRSGGALDFTVRYNGPSGSADVIVDVLGYFVENAATPLDCQTQNTHGSGTGDWPNLTTAIVTPAACPTGFTSMNFNCHYDLNDTLVFLQNVSGFALSECKYINRTGGTLSTNNIGAERLCCRVPGQ